jgi:hypothetical protein
MPHDLRKLLEVFEAQDHHESLLEIRVVIGGAIARDLS